MRLRDLRLKCREWLTELININYILRRKNEDELRLICQLGKCNFYNKGCIIAHL